MGTADRAKPLAAQVALHPILVRVVGDLAEGSEVRSSVPQAPHGLRSGVVPTIEFPHAAAPNLALTIGIA
jgi:hypothetical protein